MSDTTRLLLDLYRAAREVPENEFQEQALKLIKPSFEFVEAAWGEGKLSMPGVTPRHIHMHRADPERLRTWKSINVVDKAIPIAVPRRGETIQFHAPSLFSAPEDAAMRDYTSRFGHQCYLITVFETKDPSDVAWISLYRPEPDHHFTAAERDLCEGVMPHFAQALQINRICNGARVLAREADDEVFCAVTNSDGTVLFAQSGFLSFLEFEWSQSGSTFLPEPLVNGLCGAAGGRYVGRHVVFEGRAAEDCVLIKARKKCPLDTLSPRRMEIAWMFVRGFSHKAIARKLGLSPITVRNHLSTVYRELGIAGKVDLVNLSKTFVSQRV